MLALGNGKQFGHALIQLRQLLHELRDLPAQLGVLSLKCGDIDHGAKRSRPAIAVDPLPFQIRLGASIPPTPRRREVDASEQ